MAKKLSKVNISADEDDDSVKVTRTVSVKDSVDTEQPAVDPTEAVTELEDLEKDPTPSLEVAPATQAEMRKGWVRFRCTKDLDPAPRVGNFHFTHDLGVHKLESTKDYVIPMDVAIHLVDKKFGVIV